MAKDEIILTLACIKGGIIMASDNLVLGVLGTGHFASYTIKALRNGGYQGRIILSPRNRQYAENLRDQQGCEIAASNQAVVDGADIVVLSVRPDYLSDVLEGLSFSDDQVILSALAGVSLAQLRAHSNLPQQIIRIMPSSFIEAGDAVFPMHPAHELIESLFAQAGSVVLFEQEADFERSVVMACAYGWVYELMGSMTDWFTEQGWSDEVARDMVVRHVRGATTFALANPQQRLSDIADSIALEGTFTKLGLDELKQQDAFTTWRRALQKVEDEL